MTSYEDVRKARNLHAEALKDYEEAANDLANAEYEYDIIRGAATKVERDSGTPITIIDKLVKGEEKVAAANRKVTLCKAMLKVAEARVQATYNDWKVSEREGLWVYLCEECHESPIFGVHAKRKLSKDYTCTDDEHLRWHAQQMWECRRVNEGMTWGEARDAWRSLAKSGMPSYSYVQDDGHGMWIHDWK